MNLALSNNAPASSPVDPTPANRSNTAADSTEGSAPNAADAAADDTSPAFGRILSDHLNEQAAAPATAKSPDGAKRDAMMQDGATDVATPPVVDPTKAGGRFVLLDGAVRSTATRGFAKDGGTGVKADGPATIDGRDRATDDGGDDACAVGTDLAAQLALASQWAALAAPKATPNGTAPATGDDSLALKAKIDTIRGAATKAVNAATATNTTNEVAATQAALSPAVQATVGAAALALDRTTRGLSSTVAPTLTAGAAIGQSAGKPEDPSRLSAIDGTTVAIERLFALSTGAAPGAGDNASANQIASSFASSVAAQAANTAAAGAASPGPSSTDALREPVGTPGWSHDVGQATLRMAANDLQNISLRLNPEHLGPLDVQMRIDNGVAHLQFGAAQAETRQALEASRTTLDQMFNDQGMKLGDWSVGHSSSDASFARDFQSSTSQGDGGRRAAADDTSGPDGVASITVTARGTGAVGLVDTFA